MDPLGSQAGRTTTAPVLSLVVPLFNEEESLDELHERTRVALEALGLAYEVILVDDGSHDATPRRIAELARADPRIRALHLSRNFGHQAAVTAGIDHARGEAVIVIDGDLQDPPELIPEFVAAWRRGFEVVYGVRRRRDEPWLKRLAYAGFYRLLRAVSDVEIPLDSGDFGLMDRRVVEVLRHLPERLRFVRGLRSFVGFRQVGVPYDRPARAAGRSKYTLRSLIRLAVDGLVSFSGYPLRLVAYAGITVTLLSIALAVWAFCDALGPRTAPQGWTSTLVVVLFLGAAQILGLGIVGEYVRQIFLEVKGRPTYILRPPDTPRPRVIRRFDVGTGPVPARKARKRPAGKKAVATWDRGIPDRCDPDDVMVR